MDGTVLTKPNILMIIVEQQQGRVLENSQCHTPNLDSLSDHGVRFERHHTCNAVCSPSRASIFTGEYPSTHGMVDVTQAVPAYRAKFDTSLPTWSRILADSGYIGGYFGKWHVERSENLEQFGFSYYLPNTRRGDLLSCKEYVEYRRSFGLDNNQHYRKTYFMQHRGYGDKLLYGVRDEPVEASETYYIFSKAIEFIRNNQDNNWFAVIGTQENHDPYIAPWEFYEKYSPDRIALPESINDNLENKPNIQKRLRKIWEQLGRNQLQEAIACYYANATFIDSQVGRLVDTLTETDQLENTVILYTADHGDLLGAHGLFLKSFPAYEEVYHVPLIISGPGIKSGMVTDALTSHVDIAPTLVDLSGNGSMQHIAGRSMKNLITKGDAAERWDLGFAEFHGVRLFATQRIIWSGNYKYIFNGFDFDELYDLERDPNEIHNLAAEPKYGEIIEGLVCKMWKKTKEIDDYTLLEATDLPHRILPIGPHCEKQK